MTDCTRGAVEGLLLVTAVVGAFAQGIFAGLPVGTRLRLRKAPAALEMTHTADWRDVSRLSGVSEVPL